MKCLRLLVTSSFLLFTLGLMPITATLSIEPSHDTPCVVGDAWAEECMSCTCLQGRVAACKPTLCASRLRRALDECKEGEVTRIDCNTCRCKNNQRVCTKKNCDNSRGHLRSLRKSKRRGKREKKMKPRLN